MSEAIFNSRAMESKAAIATSALQSGWTALRSLVVRWSARQRFSHSIAHLDDQMLADVGFTPQDLGLGEHLIRRHVAGRDVWLDNKMGDKNRESGDPGG